MKFIEKAGTGILRMREAVREHGGPPPTFESTGFFTAIFQPLAAGSREATGAVGATPEVTPEVAPEVTPEVRLLKVMKGKTSRQSLQDTLGLKDAEHFRRHYLSPALEAGIIEMTIPEKPRSSKQRYQITSRGLEVLKKSKEKP